MDPAIPLAACDAFERLHGVTVALHDPAGRFCTALPFARLRHRHPACAAVKTAGHERACVAFDMEAVHAECLRRPDGFLKVCHGGLLEAVVPRVVAGALRWALFAGPWRDDGRAVALRSRGAIAVRAPAPPPATRAADLLEALRALAARLAEWERATAPSPLPAQVLAAGMTRRQAVEAFLADRHVDDVGLDDLADALGLSPSRTSHLVSELFGRPWAALLAERRGEAAAALLRHTDLPVAQVALRSGHGDLSHFHAAFRARFGITPAAYRRAQREV